MHCVNDGIIISEAVERNESISNSSLWDLTTINNEFISFTKTKSHYFVQNVNNFTYINIL